MKPLYCVRHMGIGEYLCDDLTSALRYIARRFNQPMVKLKCAEVVAAGWEVGRV